MTISEWVQAIVAIVGIVISTVAVIFAIWVPYRQRKDQQQSQDDDKRRKGRAIGNTVRVHIDEWRGRCVRVAAAPIPNLPNVQFLSDLEAGEYAAPEALEKLVSEFWLLDGAGDLLFEALQLSHYTSKNAGKVLASLSNTVDKGDHAQVIETLRNDVSLMREILANVLKSLIARA